MEKVTVEQYCKERNATTKYVSQHTDYVLFHKGDLGDPGVGVSKQRPPKYWYKMPVYTYKLPYDKATMSSIRKQFKAGKISRMTGIAKVTMITMWHSSEVAPAFSELENMYYRSFDYCLYMKYGIFWCDILDALSRATVRSTPVSHIKF